jgi:hypothetical protein
MTKIQTIVTAAKDSRPLFLPAGFGQPKSLIRWEGREVLLRAIDSYVVDSSECWVAISADENHQFDLSGKIQAEFPDVRVGLVPSGVKGALASSLLVLEGIDLQKPLVVAAGDSMLEGGVSPHLKRFIADGADAGTVAFESTNPRWSYLSVGADGRVRQVAEKRVIGALATTGVFFFKRAADFLDAAIWCLVNNASNNGTFYVSSTLNYMISQGKTVQYSTISRAMYRSWSLPVDFTLQSE